MHNVLQHRGDVDALLGGDLRRVQRGQADDVLNLMLPPPRVGGGQVDFIEHRADLQVVVQGQIGVGQRLGLHPLGGVHHQHRPLAGGQGTAHFVVEVHMARGVDEIEAVGLPVLGGVVHADGPGLDGDAPLPFQLHIIQQLGLHLPLLHRPAQLDHAVGQCGFPVVDMGDNGKIANFRLVCHAGNLREENPSPPQAGRSARILNSKQAPQGRPPAMGGGAA